LLTIKSDGVPVSRDPLKKERMMFTVNESNADQSESVTPNDPLAPMDATIAFGMDFDPHHFHGATVDGEAEPEAARCPFAQFFSGIFGDEKG